jgi:hypothetical protein
MNGIALQVYREKFRITSWRDGCVFSTESLGCDWFDESVVDSNHPSKSNMLFVAASDDFARGNMTVRRKPMNVTAQESRKVVN